MMLKRWSFALLLVVALAGGAHSQVVKPGIDVLRERGFDVLKGKSVGLITNPTGITASLEATIDVLSKAPGLRLVALYGPEHGVRGMSRLASTSRTT